MMSCPNAAPIVGLSLRPLLISNPLKSSTPKSKCAILVPLRVTGVTINESFKAESASLSKYTCVVING